MIIQKSDIVGARIVDVHQTCDLKDGLDCREIYFTVDRGFTFLMPLAGIRWAAVELPDSATRMDDEIVSSRYAVKHWWFGIKRFIREPDSRSDVVRQIKQRQIVGVYCAPEYPGSDDHLGEGTYLLFDDGSEASNCTVAPHGTGAAGLYYHPASSGQNSPETARLDYFSIPIANGAAG